MKTLHHQFVSKNGYRIYDVKDDGSCLYSACIHQLLEQHRIDCLDQLGLRRMVIRELYKNHQDYKDNEQYYGVIDK